jgi:hypothetical protein
LFTHNPGSAGIGVGQISDRGAYGWEPERRGHVAELGGEDWADEWTGAGDGGEVMAEGDPAGGRDIVAAVGEARRGGRLGVVEFRGRIRDSPIFGEAGVVDVRIKSDSARWVWSY